MLFSLKRLPASRPASSAPETNVALVDSLTSERRPPRQHRASSSTPRPPDETQPGTRADMSRRLAAKLRDPKTPTQTSCPDGGDDVGGDRGLSPLGWARHCVLEVSDPGADPHVIEPPWPAASCYPSRCMGRVSPSRGQTMHATASVPQFSSRDKELAPSRRRGEGAGVGVAP